LIASLLLVSTSTWMQVQLRYADSTSAEAPQCRLDLAHWALNLDAAWLLLAPEYPVACDLPGCPTDHESIPMHEVSLVGRFLYQPPDRGSLSGRGRVSGFFGEPMYTITIKGEQFGQYQTLADVLYQLNLRPKGGLLNPFSQHLDHVEIWNAQRRYPRLRRGCNHVAPILDETGTPKTLVNTMLDEDKHYARGPDGTSKRLEHMTHEEWGAIHAIHAIGSICYGVIPCFSAEILNAAGWMTEFAEVQFLRRFGYGHDGPTYHKHDTNSRHEVHVAYALARGVVLEERVLEHYVDGANIASFDPMFFREVICKPFLRGRFRSVEELADTVSVLGRENPVKAESVDQVVRVMAELPLNADRVAIENQLYLHGLLTPFEEQPFAQVNLGVPINDFANRLREALVKWKMARAQKSLEAQVKDRLCAQREFERQQAVIRQMPLIEPYHWANKVAAALQERDLAFLLGVLDNSHNEPSQRAVETECGVKLRRVPATERRRAIFFVAGFTTDVEYQQAEADFAAEMLARTAARDKTLAPTRLKQAKDCAAMHRLRFEGRVIGGDVFVETLLARGFRSFRQGRRGCVLHHYLCNGSMSYKLHRTGRTLEYAQRLLEADPANAV
jgi:hypothetical protein